MARKRSIDPDIWTDEKVQQLSLPAMLLYVGLISNADDSGRIEWSANQLRTRIFPARDDVSRATVEEWMEEVVEASLVLTYRVGAKIYAVHPSWARHQYVTRPTKSKLPEPPPELGLSPAIAAEPEAPELVASIDEADPALIEDSEASPESDASIHGAPTEDSVQSPESSPSPHGASSDDSVPTVTVLDTVTGTETGNVSGLLSQTLGEQVRRRSPRAKPGPKPDSPDRSRRIKPDPPSSPSFSGALEVETVAFVASLAARNATGTITEGRVATVRREIAGLVDEFGFDAVVRGLVVGNAAGADSLGYARKVAAGFATEHPRPIASVPREQRSPIATIAAEDRDGAFERRKLQVVK